MFDRKTYNKQWLKDNPEYKKNYYQKNKGKISIQFKKQYKDNPEYHKKNNKKWRKNNSEYIKEYNNKYNINNPEYKKEYYRKNIKNILEGCRKYYKTEKGKASDQRKRFKRRAREKEIINTLTAKEWLDILRQHNFKCIYCGKDLFDLFNKPTRDHIIPISKGGNNTKENIVPACRSCNNRKYNKIL
jgi:5-methylcytosine-specific restriction endonuclease McrA